MPVGPVFPVFPVVPVFPVKPVGPVAPVAPVLVAEPGGPSGPVFPVGPENPVAPVLVADPAGPCGPVFPVGPVRPVAPVFTAVPAGPVHPVGPVDPVIPVPKGDDVNRKRASCWVDHSVLIVFWAAEITGRPLAFNSKTYPVYPMFGPPPLIPSDGSIWALRPFTSSMIHSTVRRDTATNCQIRKVYP